MRDGFGVDGMIEALADKLEADLGRLEACWSEIPDEERGAVITRIGSNAPGVARLLCPQFGRFTGFTHPAVAPA